MRRRRPAWSGCVWAILVFGCDSGTPGTPDATLSRDAPSEAPPLPAELPLPDIQCEPTFESLLDNLFVPTCALPLCHIGSDAALLKLDTAAARDALVGAPALCKGWVRVAPGDPEASFLWHKLTMDDPECGDRMPWGFERLPDNALECVRGWIQSL